MPENLDGTCRAFIAFSLEPEAEARCEDLLARLRGAGLRCKWVAPENLHVTAYFLGDRRRGALLTIAANVQKLAARLRDVVLTATALDSFGHPPRTLFLSLADAGGAAEALVRAVREDNGLEPEPGQWRAHLTLGRSRGAAESRTWPKAAEIGFEPFSFRPPRLGVFVSRLTPAGPVYTELEV